MNRRQATRNILLAGAGVTLLPYCSTEDWPSFENLGLENKAYRTTQALIDQILPDNDENIQNQESRLEFVLKQVNDRFSSEDIEQFKAGLEAVDQAARTEHGRAFSKLPPEQQMATILAQAETESPAAFCIQRTKRLCVEHFTRSEYYMKNLLDFEFAPGRYVGCAKV
jgi:hypothetical protein